MSILECSCNKRDLVINGSKLLGIAVAFPFKTGSLFSHQEVTPLEPEVPYIAEVNPEHQEQAQQTLNNIKNIIEILGLEDLFHSIKIEEPSSPDLKIPTAYGSEFDSFKFTGVSGYGLELDGKVKVLLAYQDVFFVVQTFLHEMGHFLDPRRSILKGHLNLKQLAVSQSLHDQTMAFYKRTRVLEGIGYSDYDKRILTGSFRDLGDYIWKCFKAYYSFDPQNQLSPSEKDIKYVLTWGQNTNPNYPSHFYQFFQKYGQDFKPSLNNDITTEIGRKFAVEYWTSNNQLPGDFSVDEERILQPWLNQIETAAKTEAWAQMCKDIFKLKDPRTKNQVYSKQAYTTLAYIFLELNGQNLDQVLEKLGTYFKKEVQEELYLSFITKIPFSGGPLVSRPPSEETQRKLESFRDLLAEIYKKDPGLFKDNSSKIYNIVNKDYILGMLDQINQGKDPDFGVLDNNITALKQFLYTL